MKLRTLLIAAVASILSATLAVQADLAPGINSTANVVWNLAWEVSTTKPTYAATTVITGTTAPKDLCAIQGSATKTIRVRRILLSGVGAVVQSEQFAVNRLAGSYTGAGLNMSSAVYDSTSAAATAVAEYWTTAPAQTGTETWLTEFFFTWNNATTGVGAPFVVEFGKFGSAADLRGTSQWLALYTSTGFASTDKLACTIEWTEE